MGIQNPRMLITILEDLQHILSRWTMRASDTISTASHTQRQSEEQVDRALHRAQIVLDQAEQDRDAVTKQQEKVSSLLSLSRDSRKTAHQTLADVMTALKKAQSTLKLWQAELDLALKWLARAEERLRKALEDLAKAKAELAAAQRELSNAESDLQNCVNDKDRHDCSGPRKRVERAKDRVAEARAWVTRAEAEVEAARKEVERAKARVQCCRIAVGHAEQAVSLAQEAQERANMAINASERSVEHAEAAERNVQQAEQRVIKEEEESDLMMQDVQIAARQTSEGRMHFHNADRAAESAQRFTQLVNSELNGRMEQLHLLNRATLSSGGYARESSTVSPSGSSSVSRADILTINTMLSALVHSFGGGHGYKYQKARQEFLRGLVDDPNQPGYVRGWIKQELNRLERIEHAKSEGHVYVDSGGDLYQGPGGNKHYLRGIPGLDVGHIYPDIDLPENFRLEHASANRARPGIARRLGIDSRR